MGAESHVSQKRRDMGHPAVRFQNDLKLTVTCPAHNCLGE